MIYKHDRTSPAQVQTAETTLLPETMLVVQSGGSLSRFHSTEVCKTSPTSAQHGHGRLALTQARETHLPAALDLSEGWMRLWWGPRDGDAHMRTCTHFGICAFSVGTKQHFPAWTLTQTDTGSSPGVSVPIATALCHQNHITYCRLFSSQNGGVGTSGCIKLPSLTSLINFCHAWRQVERIQLQRLKLQSFKGPPPDGTKPHISPFGNLLSYKEAPSSS